MSAPVTERQAVNGGSLRTAAVVGWQWNPARRRLRSLLLALPMETGWRYVGHVEAGLPADRPSGLLRMMLELELPVSPLRHSIPMNGLQMVRWVAPLLAGEVVSYGAAPVRGTWLRPRWVRLRPDLLTEDLLAAD